jgi:hypothetical protein
MKSYENFEQIEQDLKRLNLERQIALEELKIVKHGFERKLKPINMISGVLKFVSKYGLLMIAKKVFK